MFKQNPFGIAVTGATNTFSFPTNSGETASKIIKCVIDKKNLDAKNPPTHPFNIQVAMKTSLDVFYYEVQCMLHCLIDFATPMKADEFKKFWEMIGKQNEGSLSI